MIAGPFLSKEEGKGVVRTTGKMLPGRGNVRGTEAMDQSNDAIAQGSEDVGA